MTESASTVVGAPACSRARSKLPRDMRQYINRIAHAQGQAYAQHQKQILERQAAAQLAKGMRFSEVMDKLRQQVREA